MKYRRLPGKKKSFLYGRFTLWEGDDHLLAVTTNYFTENYKRYYYKDIKALTLCKTRNALIHSIIWGSILILALLFLLSNITGNDIAGITWWAFLSAVIFPFLLIHILKGPSSLCRITTPLGQEELPSLCRVRAANKAINRITTSVEHVQGILTGQQSQADIPSSQVAEPANVPFSGQASEQFEASRPMLTSLLPHASLFGLFILHAAIAGIRLSHAGMPIYLLHGACLLALFALTIITLVKQTGKIRNFGISFFTWTGLAILIFFLSLGYYFSMFIYMLERTDAMATQLDQYIYLSSLRPLDHTFLFWVYLIYIVLALVVGGGGILSLLKWKREISAEQSGR